MVGGVLVLNFPFPHKRTRRNEAPRGFTLIELLLVVAIILILIAIALPQFQSALIRARVAKSAGDVYVFITALETYWIDWQVYPIDHHADYPYWGASEFGFTMLTTPIAYMKQWSFDPFGTRQTNDPTVENIASTYYGGSGSDNPACGGRSHYGDPNSLDHGKSCGHAYLVFGIGPDKEITVYGWNEFPSGDPSFHYPSSINTYSPSNGTKSPGDLHRLTGDWNRHTVQIDGQFAAN